MAELLNTCTSNLLPLCQNIRHKQHLGRHLFWVEVSGDTVHHGAGEGMAPGFHFQQGEHESAAIYILAAAEEAERRSQNGLKPSAM